ncbi:MAG TPA: RusA family crossover junction endodeoxyribonuclease [Longimicrobium sp.]|nr:RusA family crossover junction endodeoxyribonuclease [Longimicrobium sp.]
MGFPFEFIVRGPPRSAKTRNRPALRQWKNAVADAALLRFPADAALVTEKLRMVVSYYHDGADAGLDLDNMLKPIRDALNGVVYEDDSQIVVSAFGATPIDGRYRVKGISTVLAEGFRDGLEFLHVVIEPAPDDGELLK